MSTREAVIVSTARTPIGKAYRGAFNQLTGATLGAAAVTAAVERAGISPDTIEDGVATTITGSNLVTVTSVALEVDGSNYSVDQSFVIDVDHIDFTPETNIGAIAPLPTIPFTDAVEFNSPAPLQPRLAVTDA